MTKIKWYPYPKTEPKKTKKSYLVTCVDRNRHKVVTIDYYAKKADVEPYTGRVKEAEWGFYSRVVAWAELPEPYKTSK